MTQIINRLKYERVLKRNYFILSNCLVRFGEACCLFLLVKKTKKIKGDLVEVGVYKGGSAKIICLAKGARPLHLFDTFKGLPSVDYRIDPTFLYKGLYAASLLKVKKYLKKYKKVYYYKGVFPKTAAGINNRRFSLVHLDVDTYQSTKDCLKFFYPRMNRGGVIISHDYFSVAKGVARAFDEYFQTRKEVIIKAIGSQCMITKL